MPVSVHLCASNIACLLCNVRSGGVRRVSAEGAGARRTRELCARSARRARNARAAPTRPPSAVLNV
eukprot:1424841-Pleurochrysis_carterae.AAC.1